VSSSKAIKRRYNILDDQTLYIYDVILSDKGSVTCEASNGYGPPIRATATLTVEFRARVNQMLPVAYAGISLPLKLYCPAIAEPPLNSISWEKDGNNLRVQQNPRFSTDGNGSLIIHSVDHRDAGEYTCTPYNIVGTVGRSPPTRVLIRDPPVFTTSPKSIYERIIGTTLSIPCAGNGDPFPAISWRKLSPGFAPKFCVDGGNLSIASLRKSHHGVWQCVLSNPVADVTTDVMVFVKNTTPHAVNNFTAHALGDSSVQVRWTPGYNGGFPQYFTLWYKRVDQGDHTWMTVSIKNGDGTVVRNLISATLYQFSVIPENQKGKGPFSDTIT
uniref:Uncharacterized protein n=1 Tax=Ciona savignyi TaxID=51511 RepID=H2YGJ8_CIOSA